LRRTWEEASLRSSHRRFLGGIRRPDRARPPGAGRRGRLGKGEGRAQGV